MQRSFAKLVWYRLTQWSVGLAARVWFRLQCRNLNQVPASGPVLLLANHQSHLDPPLIGCFVKRPLSILARDTLFHGVLGHLIRSYHAIPIDRDSSGLAGIRETLKRLKQGDAVLLFPEGTRSPDGQLQPLEPGFLALARRGKATVVPIAIAGAYQAMPRGSSFPRPRKIALAAGEPLTAAQVAALEDEQLLAEIETGLQESLKQAQQLLGPTTC